VGETERVSTTITEYDERSGRATYLSGTIIRRDENEHKTIF